MLSNSVIELLYVSIILKFVEGLITKIVSEANIRIIQLWEYFYYSIQGYRMVVITSDHMVGRYTTHHNNKLLLRAIFCYFYKKGIFADKSEFFMDVNSREVYDSRDLRKINLSAGPLCKIEHRGCTFIFEKSSENMGQNKYVEHKIKILSKQGIQYISDMLDEIYNFYIQLNSGIGDSQYVLFNIQDHNELSFVKHPFKSEKTFENLFFPEKEEVIRLLDRFNEKDITRLSLFLHGKPGCGKTSLIKAIANKTGRHIINIKLSNLSSDNDLMHIFFDQVYSLENNSNTDYSLIPFDKRIYVFEDVDADNYMIKKRKFADETPIDSSDSEPDTDNKEDQSKGGLKLEIKDQSALKKNLTLSCFLNILDGVVELHNVIIIFTTNRPHVIDPALIRPGRITKSIEMREIEYGSAKEMIRYYFEQDLPKEVFQNVNITAATLENYCIEANKDYLKVISKIVK